MASLVLCEGKHALNALEELFNTSFSCASQHEATKPSWYNPVKGSGLSLRTVSNSAGAVIPILSTGGRPKLWPTFKASLSPEPWGDRIGVCFDPDLQTEADWRQALQSRLPADPATWSRRGDRYIVNYPNGREIEVFPLPWPTLEEREEGDSASLYRTVIECLSSTHPEHSELVQRWKEAADKLAMLGKTATNDWKRDCWFWMAGWDSDAECEFFFRRAVCLTEVQKQLSTSPQTRSFWQGLQALAGKAPSSPPSASL